MIISASLGYIFLDLKTKQLLFLKYFTITFLHRLLKEFMFLVWIQGESIFLKNSKPFCKVRGLIIKGLAHTNPNKMVLLNGKNRHIIENVWTLLLDSHVPSTFWCEATQTTIYLINRLPSKTLNGKTPYNLLFKSSPNYNALQVLVVFILFTYLLMNELSFLFMQPSACS